MDNMLSYRIEGWLEDKQKWYTQEEGNNPLETIMSNWHGWVDHAPHTHYRLFLIVTREIILTENK